MIQKRARTNAIDSDLILEHPDWFYWIRCDEMGVDEQFKAFVEACHLLNIRVIIDIIPRTNAI